MVGWIRKLTHSHKGILHTIRMIKLPLNSSTWMNRTDIMLSKEAIQNIYIQWAGPFISNLKPGKNELYYLGVHD